MTNRKVVVAKTDEELKKNVINFITETVREALKERDSAIVGVSGGSMPGLVAPLIEAQTAVDWSKVRFFAVDERMVPLDDKESNTGSFLRLLSHQFHSLFLGYGPINDSAKCAENYTKSLMACGPVLVDGWPQFDLLLLGHGPDGHTCSLFPGHLLLKETSRVVAFIEDSPKPPPKRITLTLPAVNSAKHVAFISAGSNKADILKSIVDDQDQTLPAVLVQPHSGSLHFFLDSAAASKLKLD